MDARWDPDPPDAATCQNCGEHLSPTFRRVWSEDDGTVPYCMECVPRTIRFGIDPKGRTPEDVDDFDPEISNKGEDPGGIERREVE